MAVIKKQTFVTKICSKKVDKHLFVLYTKSIEEQTFCKGGIIMRKKSSKDKRTARRMYKKTIAVILMFVMIAGFSGYFGKMLTSAHENTEDEVPSLTYMSIEIHPGDTLWSIAEEYMPDSCDSVEDYISELRKLNSLNSDEIHANQYLMVSCVR